MHVCEPRRAQLSADHHGVHTNPTAHLQDNKAAMQVRIRTGQSTRTSPSAAQPEPTYGRLPWPIQDSEPLSRAWDARWPGSNRSMQSSPRQCGHTPCAGHCPSTLRASGALFGAVSLALRARARSNARDRRRRQDRAAGFKTTADLRLATLLCIDSQTM